MKTVFAAIIAAIVMTGCAAMHHGPSVCDNPKTMADSWLCQAAATSGVPLEEYGYIILDAEALAIISERITSENIKKFCGDVRALLNVGRVPLSGKQLTYRDFILQISADAKSRAISNLLSRRLIIFNSDLPVSTLDIGFLMWQLDQIEALVI